MPLWLNCLNLIWDEVGGCNRQLKVALIPLNLWGSPINPSWDFEMVNLMTWQSLTAELAHAELDHTKLAHAKLDHAELAHAELTHAELAHAKLRLSL